MSNASPTATNSIGSAFAVDDEGFDRALEVRPFVFPDDYGPHPSYAIEWWYYTGNLTSDSGRRFGYQLTFFRNALAPESPERTSAWATRQFYFAHFGLTDINNEEFHAFSRQGRAAAGLAGAQASPYKVWVGPWVASSLGTDTYPVRLQAADKEADIALDLVLEQAKPEVFQGDRGLSQKGPEAGNASYYFSATRMPSTGTVQIGDETLEVTGLSWLDREWSSGGLSDDHVGWDWFALQLDDGRDVMLGQLRREDGTVEPRSHGALVAEDGTKTYLALDDYSIEVTETWDSPRGGRYPAGWRIRVPQADLDVTVRPFVADQELDVETRYWEGAIEITGSATGRGYAELVGYAAASAD
ncbi:MAG: lipocalin-like domain-containing protein [Acidobacteriota bacterium]